MRNEGSNILSNVVILEVAAITWLHNATKPQKEANCLLIIFKVRQ